MGSRSPYWDSFCDNDQQTEYYPCHNMKILNVQQADSVNSKLSREEEELESLKTECNDAGCKIQSLQAETESIRALVGQLSQSVMQKNHEAQQYSID